ASARDLGYGPFVQGAGQADGLRAVDLARGAAGLEIAPPAWIPGQQYAGGTGVVLPGTTVTQAFTLTNPTGSSLTVTLGTTALAQDRHTNRTQIVVLIQ